MNQSLSADSANAQPEVRRCARCGAAALICTAAWQHQTYGVRTGTQTCDYHCQACGTKVTLHPALRIWVLRGFGVLTLPVVIPGLVFLVLAQTRANAWKNNPIVPGAPWPAAPQMPAPQAGAAPPRPRYHGEPADRRCAVCQGSMRVTKITRKRSRGLPAGTDYEYKCTGCNKQLELESAWGTTVSLFGASLLGLIGSSILIVAKSPGIRFGLGGIIALLSLVLVWDAFSKLRAGLQNPEIPNT